MSPSRKHSDDEQPDAPRDARPPWPPESLPALASDELRRLRNALRSHIPSDPTFIAAVSRILIHLLDLNLAHPDRLERDAALARENAERRAAASAEALAARQAAEKAALPEDHPDRAAIEEKHAAEVRALERDRRLAELDAAQAAARDEFAQAQAQQRAQLQDEYLHLTG